MPDMSRRPRNRGTGSPQSAPTSGQSAPSIMNTLKRRAVDAKKFFIKYKRICALCAAAIGLVLLVFGVGAVIGAATRLNAAEVYISGTLFATIDKPQVTDDDIKTQVVAAIRAELGDINIQLTDEIKVKPVRADSADIKPFDVVLTAMRDAVKYNFEALRLRVDGISYAILRSQEECDALLDSVKEPYMSDSTINATFVEDVTTEPVFITEDELTSVETAFDLLTETIDTPEEYVIEAGDTLDAIAIEYDLPKTKIYELNPSIEEQERRLQIGQIVKVVVPKPVLSVRTVFQTTYTTVEPKKTETRELADKPRSYSRVVQEGRDGQKEVTENILRINGFEQSEREFVSEKITVKPVDEIIEVGVQ